MKKIALIITLAMLLSIFGGCAGTTVVIGNCTCPTEDSSPVPDANDSGLRIGLSIVGTCSSEKKDTSNKLSFDVTVAAVTVDAQGVIRSCRIDSLNPTVEVDTQGQMLTDTSSQILTKYELGEDYGMKRSGSKLEWYEQVDAVADYAIGKTATELKNGAISESGKPTDADLASSASIYIGGYVSAIVSAAEQAQSLGAEDGDELKLAIIPTLANSANATAEGNGTVELLCDVAAITVNGDTITSCYIDSLQAQVSITAQGEFTTDLSAPFLTKNQKGEDYGMKKYANSQYEWNEQTASFCLYVTGKTLAQVEGIHVNEKAAPTDADLASSVTISIGGFQALIHKALG